MALHIKNLLKQLPFYGKTIKPKIKEFTNTKLLSELLFEKPIKVKIEQLSIKKLLREQPFYKQPTFYNLFYKKLQIIRRVTIL